MRATESNYIGHDAFTSDYTQPLNLFTTLRAYGYTDSSYRNDVCPSVSRNLQCNAQHPADVYTVSVHIDHRVRSRREEPSWPRYQVSGSHDISAIECPKHCEQSDDSHTLAEFSTNSMAELERHVDRLHRQHLANVERCKVLSRID